MPKSKKHTVLIVDDDPQVRELFSDYLSGRFDVLSAASGNEALELLDDSIDVVLLDRKMPGLSGKETLGEIRDSGFDLPVSLVTAVEPDFDILGMGFDDYVVKPIRMEEINDLVDTLLLRQEYDEVIREYFSLVSKVTALDRRKREGELIVNDEYLEQSQRLEEIKKHAHAALNTAIDSGKFDEMFKDLTSGHQAPDDENDVGGEETT